jgi:hypothetical protein
VRILFDQGTPVPLRQFLSPHDVETVFERDWHRLKNGELLEVAESHAFSVFITTDQHLREQQALGDRNLAIVVLLTTDWGIIRDHTDRVSAALANLSKGAYVEVAFPGRDTGR